MMLLIKLFLAHLAGDFFLQPASWVKAKEEKKLLAYQLYLHATIHGLLIMLLVWDVDFLPWAGALAASHLVIDGLKITLQKPHTKRFYFFADQLQHILSICAIYCLYNGCGTRQFSFFNEGNLLLITMLLFLTMPCSLIIKVFIAKWQPDPQESTDESLQEAGKYIGMIERLLVFVFIITGHWEAVGFLIAAKSVFRFGDLKESRQRKLTEYILIGTLTSFGIAILTGLAYLAWI